MLSPFLPLGYDRIAELLIENGADVNIVGKNTNTTLAWAAKLGKKLIFIHL